MIQIPFARVIGSGKTGAVRSEIGGVSVQRHETDAVSFTFGLIFLILGIVFLSGSVNPFDFVSVWALPAGLLAIGLVLAALALTRYRNNREP